MTTESKHTPDFDKCLECGASSALHQYETEKCPQFGVEETRQGFSQQWANTTFRALDKQASETIAERDRLKEENEKLRNDLLDALDLKKGNGPTALSILDFRVRELQSLNKELITVLERARETMKRLRRLAEIPAEDTSFYTGEIEAMIKKAKEI